MRLTLRTLLAYLDDILEPAQTREIGAKVSQSGYASALIDRIREVMRRRRLTAPDLHGPGMGLDPNKVAEYLDNTLTPEAVADVEKVCLDSDMHLAEVAASHQILTLVLGEPVDVPASTRERMYALGPRPKVTGPAGSNGQPAAGKTPETVTSAAVVPTPASPADNPFESGIPDYLRPAPLWKRMAPLVAGLLIGAIWLAVVWKDFGQRPVQDAAQSPASEIESAGDDTPPDTAIASATPQPSGSVMETAMPTAADSAAALAENNPPRSLNELPNVDPAPPADMPAETPLPLTPVAAADTPRVPATPAVPPETPVPAATSATPVTTPPVVVASRTPPPATVPVQPPAPEPAAPGKSIPAPEILYSSREGLLARKDETGWLVLSHRAAIHPGDRLACPEPYSALLEVRSLGLTFELQGGTIVEYLGATEESAIQWAVHRGRVVIQRVGGTDPLACGLILAGEPTQLLLQPGDALGGLDLIPGEPSGFETPLAADERFHGGLFLIKGQGQFISQSGMSGMPENSWLPLSLRDRREIEASGNRPPLLTTPEWLDPARRVPATLKRYAARFEKEIDLDQPLRNSVPIVVMSTIPAISELATRCLAVTEQYEQLVQALSRSEFPESRDAAIAALRQWLPQAPENKDILKAALVMYFPAEHVEPVYRLLWGYSTEDARNQATSRILVDWLSHDSVVVRELAFLHIYRLTGQKYDYRPINPAPQRRSAVDRWDAHLQKHGGALLP